MAENEDGWVDLRVEEDEDFEMLDVPSHLEVATHHLNTVANKVTNSVCSLGAEAGIYCYNAISGHLGLKAIKKAPAEEDNEGTTNSKLNIKQGKLQTLLSTDLPNCLVNLVRLFGGPYMERAQMSVKWRDEPFHGWTYVCSVPWKALASSGGPVHVTSSSTQNHVNFVPEYLFDFRLGFFINEKDKFRIYLRLFPRVGHVNLELPPQITFILKSPTADAGEDLIRSCNYPFLEVPEYGGCGYKTFICRRSLLPDFVNPHSLTLNFVVLLEIKSKWHYAYSDEGCCRWTIEQLGRKRERALRELEPLHFSPYFYSHSKGFRLQLEVKLGEGFEAHLRFLRGPNDRALCNKDFRHLVAVWAMNSKKLWVKILTGNFGTGHQTWNYDTVFEIGHVSLQKLVSDDLISDDTLTYFVEVKSREVPKGKCWL